MIEIGIKSDPIHYRYSFDWLFDIMAETETKYLQLGSFFELYTLDDNYFYKLREKAEKNGIRIKSVFTAHRELGGFFTDDPHMEKVARKNYGKLIHVASLVGADYCGSNPGAVYRDQMEKKEKGMARYLSHMKELSVFAKEKGLKALTMEPMSSLAEPPTTPKEIDHLISHLMEFHLKDPGRSVPVFLCGDISHGLADADKNIVYNNLELFEYGIPMMSEFHFKNTDTHFNSTFGFSKEETQKGIIDLKQIKMICERNTDKWPVSDVVGYLEINGPKLGRDYSDVLLGDALKTSLNAIRKVWATTVKVS